MPILILTDSRGRLLQETIKGMTELVVDVSVYPGAGLDELFTKPLNKALLEKYDKVYIMGGICNITVRDRRTRITELRSFTLNDITTKFEAIITTGLANLDTEIPVVLAPIVGIDLNRYNRLPGVSPFQQLINDSVVAVNRLIITTNSRRGLSTPWVATLIHQNKGRGIKVHRYKHLADGCHFTDRALEYCATEFCKDFCRCN